METEIISVQFPRRHEIVGVARRHGVTIIEDEAQGLVSNSPLPLSAIAPEVTWTVMGLSKCFLVGLRLAYVVAPDASALVGVMQRFGGMAMWYASTLSAAVATRAIMDGSATTILQSIRREAAFRKKLACDHLPGDAILGAGPLHLWLSSSDRDGDALAADALKEYVLVRSGTEFRVPGSKVAQGVRVSMADVSHQELASALQRFSRIL